MPDEKRKRGFADLGKDSESPNESRDATEEDGA